MTELKVGLIDGSTLVFDGECGVVIDKDGVNILEGEEATVGFVPLSQLRYVAYCEEK